MTTISTSPNLANFLLWYAYTIYSLGRPFDVSPPPGGFINNDSTEYNAITGPEVALLPSYGIIQTGDYVNANIWIADYYAGANVPTDETDIASLKTSRTADETTLSGLSAGITLSSTLTGLSTATATAVTSSDSIIVAFGKLQAQVTNALNGLNTTITNISPSLVGTGATGTQVSATKRATIHLGMNESVTSSIGGAATAVINIKICATNNATEASWTNLFTFEEDQTVTLAIALQSIQVMKGAVSFEVPAGWYWKAESSGSGTNSESILSGQQIVYG